MGQLTDNEIMQLQAQGCMADDWKNIRVAEGFLPDIIGTDLIRASAWRHGKCFSLPYQMSKYLALGMTLLFRAVYRKTHLDD